MVDTRNADLAYSGDDFMVFIAPVGTPKPTDFTALTSPWVNLGWMAKSGGEWSADEERKELEAAGALGPIRSKITKASRSIKFTSEESLNPMVRALYDNIPLSDLAPVDGIAAYDLPDRPVSRKYAVLFCSSETDGKQIWRYMSNGEITGRGSDNTQTDDYTMIELTFTGYPGANSVPAVSTLIDYGAADLSAFWSAEVQSVAITGTPTGGTFTLTLSAETTAAIAYNATASAVQSALVALSTVGSGNVTCTSGPLPGSPVTVTFKAALGNVAQMTATGSLTGGTTPAVVVTTTTAGGVPAI